MRERRGAASSSERPTRKPRAEGSTPKRRRAAAPPLVEGPERLQKILAQAGVGSRRACELLILEGRVTVDGTVINELGSKFDAATVKIAVDGQKIQPEKYVYYLVHKPKGYVSTSSDPSGRPLVQDLIPKAKERIFIVGRLDRHSEGLMLLTNDGALAQRLTHPKFGVEKTYRVTVAGDAGNEIVHKLTEGVWLAEGKVRARRARIVSKRGNATVLEVVLAEGKNREIRRMLARFDHKVLSLLRVSIGPLQLKGLSEGAWRSLSETEVERLRTGDLFSDEGERAPAYETARKPRRSSDESGDEPRPARRPRTSDAPRGRGGEERRSRFGDEPRRPGRDESAERPDRRRPRTEETGADEAEEVIFTDRMDLGGDERPRRTMRLDDHVGRGAPERRRFDDRPGPRGRSDERGDRPARSGGGTGRFDRGEGRPPRRDSGEGRPPRRDFSEGRPPRRDSGEGRFDRSEGRPPRRDSGEGRPPRRDFSEGRPPRRESGEGRFDRSEGRPPRRDSGEGRPPRRDFSEGRPPRRDSGEGRFDRSEGRPPRRDSGEGRPPRRDNDSGEPRRTILGQPSEPKPPRRPRGPSKGLPPRRRRPS